MTLEQVLAELKAENLERARRAIAEFLYERALVEAAVVEKEMETTTVH